MGIASAVAVGLMAPLGAMAPATGTTGLASTTAIDSGRFVVLGDSYSSGFGVKPYDRGTNKDSGPNDCQRSQKAWGPLVARQRGLDLDFRACQGAHTGDFYSGRMGGTWGERAQLDHLGADTSLVAFTIGGNDAQFGTIFAECALGAELLPWNTCSGDRKVTEPVAASFRRLDGGSAGSDPRLQRITPYSRLFQDARNRTPNAARIAVGYPAFFSATGGSRSWWSSRCEMIKKVDQRWMHEKTRELNRIMADHAVRNGFRFVDPVPYFAGNELCGSDRDDWFYGVSHPGRIHPTERGHVAMAAAVSDAIRVIEQSRTLVRQSQTVEKQFVVDSELEKVDVSVEDSESELEVTVVSPSGVEHEAAVGGGAPQGLGVQPESIEIAEPEPGTWKVRMRGKDVAPAGDEAVLTVAEVEAENQPPVAAARVVQDGTALRLDASGSSDPDGEVARYDWYVNLPDAEYTAEGAAESLQVPGDVPMSVTLAVQDDDGSTTFHTQNYAPLEVSRRVVNTRSRGVTPMTLRGSESLDVTAIDVASLRVGPDGTGVDTRRVVLRDVDRDGHADLTVRVRARDTGLRAGDTSLCLSGSLEDGHEFQACDGVRTR